MMTTWLVKRLIQAYAWVVVQTWISCEIVDNLSFCWTSPYPHWGRHPFGDEAVESEAVLLATAVAGASLGDWLRKRAEHPFILHAFWSPRTTE